MDVSKTQIDKLGERLKKGDISEDDLRLLDAYRLSFANAYDEVVGAIRNKLGLGPTGRLAKSTTSISEKLRRESIRLTQIQDIAGCRLVVPDIAAQNEVVQSLSSLFENVSIIDRRQKPSHGYRAVHVIVMHQGKMIEVQVRTVLQHLWAEYSEKLSDVIGLAIKYGGGDEQIQAYLIQDSNMVAAVESMEIKFAQIFSRGDLSDEIRKELASIQDELRVKFLDTFREGIEELLGRGKSNDVISD